MLQDCFTCPHEAIQHEKYLLNGQNQEMDLFSGPKIQLDLEVFSGTEGVSFITYTNLGFGILVPWRHRPNQGKVGISKPTL